MTNQFKWEDEKTPKENRSLEKEIATESEFNQYILNKINSLSREESISFFEDFIQKEKLKKGGFDLNYYRIKEEIYYSFNLIQTLKN